MAAGTRPLSRGHRRGLPRRSAGRRHSPLRDPGCRPGDDPPLLLALGVAGVDGMADGRVEPGGQFSPQTVTDAEQGLDDQMRKVMDDVNRSAPGNVTAL